MSKHKLVSDVSRAFELTGMAETPAEMAAEIQREPKLARRFLKPGGDRPGDDLRAWRIIAMRRAGTSYAEIGRIIGLCDQRVKEICFRDVAERAAVEARDKLDRWLA